MKGLIDSNLLIYASSSGDQQCVEAARFVDGALNGPDPHAITWINIAEYLAVTTQTVGNYPPVLTMSEAIANIQRIMGSPYLKLISEGATHMDWLAKILREAGGAKGHFVHDCRIAAIMMENGVDTIFTRDSEFRRIPGIKVVDPIVTNAVP